jgi:predicted SprT family Zn-dependent metalloprotease
MGGSDNPSNLVELTVEEHAAAHLSLYKKFGKEQDLIAYRMLSGLITAEEARIHAVKLANTGRKQNPDHIRKRTEARIKNGNSRPTLGKKLPPASEERKRKISEANKGNSYRAGCFHSEDTKLKMSETARARPVISCKKCGKSMVKASLVRYHGLNGEKCSI